MWLVLIIKKLILKINLEFIKINSKNIGVEKLNPGNGRIGAQMRVSPSLLFKK